MKHDKISQNSGVINQDIFDLNLGSGFFALVQMGPFETMDHAKAMSEVMTIALKDYLVEKTGSQPEINKIHN